MKIEIVVDPSRPAPAASLVARVAPPPAAAAPVTEGAPRLVSLFLFRDIIPPHRPSRSTLMRLFSCPTELVDGLEGDVVAQGGGVRGRQSLPPISMLKWRYVFSIVLTSEYLREFAGLHL